MKRLEKPRSDPKKHLVYTVAANKGLVIARLDRAEFISRIYTALSKSITWGEFRRAMPKAAYSELLPRISERYRDNGLPMPKNADRFDSSDVPGVCDGDYPDWLQTEMDSVLPEAILDEFGEWSTTMLNGGYCHIDPKHLPAIKARLEQLGYSLVDAPHLTFW